MSDAENSKKPPRKKPPGRPFPPKTSGNPGGRPAGYPAFREACQAMSSDVVKRLAHELATDGPEWTFASKLVLEYAWGKPSSAPEDVEATQALIVQIVKLGKGDDE